MDLKIFFKRFAVHIALACGFWFLAILTIERLIPCSIIPFVNLPALGLLVFILCVVASIHSNVSTRQSGILITGSFMLVVGLLLLWTRINDLGIPGLALEIAAAVLGVLCIYALLEKQVID